MSQAPALNPTPLRYDASAAKGAYWSKVGWPLLALAALLLVDWAVIGSGFFKLSIAGGRLTGSLVDVARWGGPVLLLSVGMTLVIATGGVDLSVGAVMALAGAVAAKASTPAASGGWGFSPGTAVALALVASLLAGAWNGVLVALLNIQPIVATLVLMVAGRGVAKLCIGAGNIPLRGAVWDWLGKTLLGLPSAAVWAVLVLALTALVTRRTSIGLFVEAVGGNAKASLYAGVNVRLVKLGVYVLSGTCAGLAGLVFAGDTLYANAASTGMYFELDAILATVIGGTALAGGRYYLGGTLVGALLIQTLTTTLIYKIPPQRTLVVKSVVVLAVCLLQSESLRRTLAGAFRRRPDKQGRAAA